MNSPINLFKRVLLFFWAIWWAIAFLTDLLGGFKHMSLITTSWIANTNYPFLVNSLKIYPMADFIPVVLYILIIIWSLLSCATFIWSLMGTKTNQANWMKRVDIAFITSLSFWLTFFIADQIILNFDLEQNHMVQGGFELLSYLAFYILPDKKLA
jgi:hypothetical protein